MSVCAGGSRGRRGCDRPRPVAARSADEGCVGRCPEGGAPLGSQSTISWLENTPSKTDAARLTVALVDEFGTTVTPGRMEMFDIDDTFCVAHSAQQLAFWNALTASAASRRCTSIGCFTRWPVAP
jgi:hypothetical protein